MLINFMDIFLFCGHFVCFVVIWYILLQFGIFCGNLVHFFPFCCTDKNLATLPTLSVRREKLRGPSSTIRSREAT
jgi:hypothetical protein